MIVAGQMQHGMDQQPLHLALERRIVIGGLARGGVDAHDDVAQHALRPAIGCDGARARRAIERLGREQRKAQHVGRRVLTAVRRG